MEMLWNGMAPEQSTGIHVHHLADELFYVAKGSGFALVGGREVPIGPGDVVFVPKGEDHRIRSSRAAPLELVFVVDKSGLADDFRHAHALFEKKEWPITLAKLNAFTERHGTTYKTLK
jgi:mannose-6-phosphate isomerase-like protein (cupin superfamily)